jgi:lactoylglutathione lyase
MKLLTIPYITLWAANFDEMAAFYRDKLELLVEYGDENIIQFANPGTKLYIQRLEQTAPLRDHTVEIHFNVSNVDKVYRELVERGVDFEEPPANRPWRERMAAFHDPEGYALEIIGPLNPDEPVPTY